MLHQTRKGWSCFFEFMRKYALFDIIFLLMLSHNYVNHK